MYIMTTGYDNRVYEVANPADCANLNGRNMYDVVGNQRYRCKFSKANRCPFDLRAHPLHPAYLAKWDAAENEFVLIDNRRANFEADYA